MQILFFSRGENPVTYHMCLCIACYWPHHPCLPCWRGWSIDFGRKASCST